jgi:isopentenyl diphosphate isomerase/L-lactate dehydrogenase-like FMN-dependent dehydrogenase
MLTMRTSGNEKTYKYMSAEDTTRSGTGTAAVEFENLHEIISRARQNLSRCAWDTLVGGTETETTLRRNRLAIDSIAFRPRVLRDVSRVDASAHHFGRRLRLPVLLAPTGPLEMFGRGGGSTVVQGRAEVRCRPHAQLGVYAS